jgi:hypothetical protein
VAPPRSRGEEKDNSARGLLARRIGDIILPFDDGDVDEDKADGVCGWRSIDEDLTVDKASSSSSSSVMSAVSSVWTSLESGGCVVAVVDGLRDPPAGPAAPPLDDEDG